MNIKSDYFHKISLQSYFVIYNEKGLSQMLSAVVGVPLKIKLKNLTHQTSRIKPSGLALNFKKQQFLPLFIILLFYVFIHKCILLIFIRADNS